mgnify:CR=1 FL=1
MCVVNGVCGYSEISENVEDVKKKEKGMIRGDIIGRGGDGRGREEENKSVVKIERGGRRKGDGRERLGHPYLIPVFVSAWARNHVISGSLL